MHFSHIFPWNFQIAHIFTWNFQIAFLTAYLVFPRRSKWAFEKSWKHFGPNSGVVASLAEIVDDKKWRSLMVYNWALLLEVEWKNHSVWGEKMLVRKWSLSSSPWGKGNPSVSNVLVEQPHYACGSKVNLELIN